MTAEQLSMLMQAIQLVAMAVVVAIAFQKLSGRLDLAKTELGAKIEAVRVLVVGSSNGGHDGVHATLAQHREEIDAVCERVTKCEYGIGIEGGGGVIADVKDLRRLHDEQESKGTAGGRHRQDQVSDIVAALVEHSTMPADSVARYHARLEEERKKQLRRGA